MSMFIHGFHIKGAVDRETRCKHYNGSNDRVAIKFYCCKMFFPCYQCHAEYGCGKKMVWPTRLFDEPAILCGSCGTTLSIRSYLTCQNACPTCGASFNPGCAMHRHLYFAVAER
ncbi:MAG TPA: CHY zinc finger protein [Bacillota bacterium]|nr:CHY zinc finger protein [Bacillota bacterium]